MNLPHDGLTGSGVVSGSGGSILGAGSFAATAPDTCDVLSNQGLSDGMGGSLDDWQVIATYACRVKPLTPRQESTEAERVAAIGKYVFTLPSDAVVTAANRLLYNGVTFEVENVGTAITGQDTILVYTRLVK